MKTHSRFTQLFSKTAMLQTAGIILLVLVALNLVPARPVYAATFTVTKTADTNDGTCDADCSLREAIGAANASPGADTITFAPALNGSPITLSIPGAGENANATGDLDITGDLTITGNGTRNTIINGGGVDRVFEIIGNRTVTMTDLTTTGGTMSGGGVYQTTANVTLNRTAHTGHTANGGSALRLQGAGTLTILNSSIHNNTDLNTNDAAAIVSAGTGTLIIVNSTLSGNSAPNPSSHGGGALVVSPFNTGSVTIRNTTFANNSAASVAGGISSYIETINIQNSIFHNNTPSSCGTAGSGAFTGGNNLMNNAGLCTGITIAAVTNFDTTLQDNGGSTNTHALLPGSNALDSGVSSCPDHTGSPLATDQRGLPRPQGTACDIGAFEYVAMVTPGATGGNGPGGVGVTDGSSTLELWLRADKGVFSDPVCTSAATDGGTVGCWQDQSGNGLHVTRATEAQRPGYLEQSGNNQPALTFSGSQFLERAYNAGFHPTNFTLYAANSVTGGTSYRTPVGNRNFTSCGYNLYATPGNTWEYWPNGGGGWATIGNAPVGLNQWTFQTATYDSINRNAFYKDGSLNATSLFAYVSCATQGSTPDFVIGNIAVNGAYGFIGNQSEVVLFGEELPSVRRILVDNYLSAKYDIALSANDIYDGDTNGNGDFDLDVAGIGQFGGNKHTQAFGAGMIVVDNSFLNDDGDWLLFGHNTAVNAKSSDVPTGGDWTGAPNPMRWARNWYIDVTDANNDGGTVDIVFDFSEAGMNGGQPPSGPASNYRLLKRSDPMLPFTDIATATAVVGDQVHFQNVDVSLLGSNFTLGTLDDGASPTAIMLTSFSSAGQTSRFIALILGTLFLTSLALLAHRRADRVH